MDSFPVATTEFLNPLDPDQFRKQAHLVVDFLADYYSNIEKYPVCSQVKPGFLTEIMPDSPPTEPQPIETILQEVTEHIVPGITHWQSPNFFGYFPSSLSTASFLGEMLLSGFDIVGFNWLASPAATELEIVVMEWLLKLLQLPKSFSFSSDGGGVIHGTTCESFVCTLVAAREKKLSHITNNREDTLRKLVIYCSDQTHCSLQKASQIIGISPNNIRAIRTTKSMNFQLCLDALLMAIKEDVIAGFVPLYLCLTVGTTQTTAVDPLGILCEVAKQFDIWCHVDAAYAGNACILPEFRHFLDGIEGANSFSFNAHKWLLTSLGCCCLWVKDRSDLTKSLSNDPEYLKNKATDSKQVVDYKDWQISLSRRFLSMKLWMVMKRYGVSGLRDFIRRHVKMAEHFEELLSGDERFEVVVPRNFATICFRVAQMSENHSNEEEANRLTKQLLDSLNGTGKVYMTHAVVENIYVIRVAIGATLTEEKHVDMLWDMVQEYANTLIASYMNSSLMQVTYNP